MCAGPVRTFRSGPIPPHLTAREEQKNCLERPLSGPIGAFRAKPPYPKPSFGFPWDDTSWRSHTIMGLAAAFSVSSQVPVLKTCPRARKKNPLTISWDIPAVDAPWQTPSSSWAPMISNHSWQSCVSNACTELSPHSLFRGCLSVRPSICLSVYVYTYIYGAYGAMYMYMYMCLYLLTRSPSEGFLSHTHTHSISLYIYIYVHTYMRCHICSALTKWTIFWCTLWQTILYNPVSSEIYSYHTKHYWGLCRKL